MHLFSTHHIVISLADSSFLYNENIGPLTTCNFTDLTCIYFPPHCHLQIKQIYSVQCSSTSLSKCVLFVYSLANYFD